MPSNPPADEISMWTTTELRENIGEALDLVHKNPIQLTSKGRERAYLISPELWYKLNENKRGGG